MSVSVKNLTKIYGKQKAVNNVSFEIKSGEIVGFLGPNGAGKSTTMKIATCYLTPSQGTIEVAGYDVLKSPLQVRKNIGYLPEHNPLYLDMYIREYLGFIGRLHKIGGKKLRDRVEHMIEICGLNRERKKKIGSLSKGYRQRVGLAQAILHDPPVLILDEPTTGLDINQKEEMLQLIRELGNEKTVIFSTHIMKQVEQICDRAIIINLGEIVADDKVASLQVLKDTEKSLLLEFEKAIDTNLLLAFDEITSVERIEDTFNYKIYFSSSKDLRPEVSKLANEQGWLILGMKLEETSLESVFQMLTIDQNK